MHIMRSNEYICIDLCLTHSGSSNATLSFSCWKVFYNLCEVNDLSFLFALKIAHKNCNFYEQLFSSGCRSNSRLHTINKIFGMINILIKQVTCFFKKIGLILVKC